MRRDITRREFLGGMAGAGVLVLGNAASARTFAANEAAGIALVGVAGRGLWFTDLLPRTKGMDLVALCDVDEYKAKGVFQKFAKLPKFSDFRLMLDKAGKDIDGVIVATPDNTHAVASAAAIRHGKAIYTEKPLTH
ncbi:MAG: Gfo/Idh/MocA family oxidoreductase, partial [Phycisphaerae bacterium]